MSTGFSWTGCVAVGAGALVTSLVLGSTAMYRRWRVHCLTDASKEEDLPWNELLALLEKRNRDRAAAGLPPQEATEEELELLLVRMPVEPAPKSVELPEDREFKLAGGPEKRAGGRRWGNPTEVHLRWSVLTDDSSCRLADLPLSPSSSAAELLHGLVVNRSTGGLGIYANKEIPHGTFVTIRAIDAPSYVPSVFAEVRHCMKGNGGFIIGCQFTSDIPWKVRVWFG